MNYEDHLWDAFDIVSAWDIPEDEFAQAVNDQARLMVGGCPEEPCWPHSDGLSVPLG